MGVPRGLTQGGVSLSEGFCVTSEVSEVQKDRERKWLIRVRASGAIIVAKVNSLL